MKKLLIILFLFVNTQVFAQTSADKTDLQNEGLKGKVKSIKVWRYAAYEDSGKIVRNIGDETQNRCYSEKYNEKGFKTEKIEYDRIDSSQSKTMYTYDANGKLNGPVSDSYNTYKYDKNNNCILETHFYLDGDFTDSILYKYDENGNLVEEKNISALKPSSSSVTVMKYDSKNQMTVYQKWNSEKKLIAHYVLKYDEKGNLTEETDFFALDTLNATTRYTYDEKGNKTSKDNTDPQDGDYGDREYWTYDANGNVTEYERSSTMGVLLDEESYTYQYDAQGNWTMKKTYIYKSKIVELREYKELVFVETRVIEYYK